MAKYQITYSCGHATEKQLFGKETDRQRYVAWAENSGSCAACIKADEEKEIEQIEVEIGLPILDGTPKQIAWARKIRTKQIKGVLSYIEGSRNRVKAGDEAHFEGMVAGVMAKLAEKNQSSWWIDNRDKSTKDMIAWAMGKDRG